MSNARHVGRSIACLPALGLAAALALDAGEAAAQRCPTTSPPVYVLDTTRPAGTELDKETLRRLYQALIPPPVFPTERVECWYVDDGDRAFLVRSPRITVTGPYQPGIDVWLEGHGHLEVYVHSLGPAGRPVHYHPLDHGHYGVRTVGGSDPSAWEYAFAGDSPAIRIEHEGGGRAGLDLRDLSLSTTTDTSFGVHVRQIGSYVWRDGRAHRARGAVIVNVIETERDRPGRVRPLLGTRGDEADAIRAEYTRGAAKGHVAVTVEGYTIATGGIVPLLSPLYDHPTLGIPLPEGRESRGVYAFHEGLGDIRVSATDSEILTWGPNAQGIFADHRGRTIRAVSAVDGSPVVTEGGGGVDIDLAGGVVRTAGRDSHGVWGLHMGEGGVDVDLAGASIETSGADAYGVFGRIQQFCDVPIGSSIGSGSIPRGAIDLDASPCPSDKLLAGTGVGDIAISVTGGTISTKAGGSYAVWGLHGHKGAVSVTVAGDAATEGDDAHAVVAEHRGASGDVHLTVGGGAIATTGANAHGAYARHDGAGDLTVAVTGGSIAVEGAGAHGVFARHAGTAGTVSVTVTGGSVAASGKGGVGVLAFARSRTAATVSAAAAGAGGGAARPADEHDGAVRVTVGKGGSVAGSTGVQVAGGATGTVEVHGKVTGGAGSDIFGTGPAIFLERGGSVTVGADGDVAAGSLGHAIVSGTPGQEEMRDLTVTVAGKVKGRIVVQDASDLTLEVKEGGKVIGDVTAVGGGRLSFKFAPGTGVQGTIYNPGNPFTVDTSFARIVYDLPVSGDVATVTVTPKGRLTGVDDEALRNDRGNLEVELQAGVGESPPAAAGRIGGLIRTSGENVKPVVYYKLPGEERQLVEVASARTAAALTFGAWDVGLDDEGDRAHRLEAYYAPRARVYEALPSLLLGLNRVSTYRQRMAAPRGANGSWARIAAEGGRWKAGSSTSTAATAASRGPGIAYDYSRYGAQAGLEIPLTDCACDSVGVSAHYRHGAAQLPRPGGWGQGRSDGRILASGFGFGMSGARRFEGGAYDGVYVDGQIAATWYQAKLESGLRGLLASKARGFGYAVAVEVGREIPTETGLMTPRARLVHSQVGVTAFTDSVGGGVAIEQGRSLIGQVGVGMEVAPSAAGLEGVRLFGALDVEGELVPKTRTRATGGGTATPLVSRAPGARARLELGLSREAEDGRHAMRGAVHVETGGGGTGYGGEVSLLLRF